MRYVYAITLLLCCTASTMHSMNSDSDSEDKFDMEGAKKVLEGFEKLLSTLDYFMGKDPIQERQNRWNRRIQQLIRPVIPEIQAYLDIIDCSSCSTRPMVTKKLTHALDAEFNNQELLPKLYHAVAISAEHHDKNDVKTELESNQLLEKLGEAMANELDNSIKTKCTALGIAYKQ